MTLPVRGVVFIRPFRLVLQQSVCGRQKKFGSIPLHHMPQTHVTCTTGTIHRDCVFLQNGESSYPTELLSIFAEPGKARLQVLVIPGNPGAAAYYSPFMQQLYNAFDGCVDIYSVSQLGHDAIGFQYGQVFNLQQQIQHKIAFLKERLLLMGRPPVFILGHSIGAYIAMHAAHLLEMEMQFAIENSSAAVPSIAQIVAIFPFLTVNPGCSKQRFLRTTARWPWLLGQASHVVGWLPIGLRRWLVHRYTKNLDPHALEATLALFQRQTTRNAFYLAQHEFKELSAPADWWLLDSLGRRVTILCAQSDMWFPEHHVQEMMREVPKVQVYRMKGQRHDFCVSEKLSAQVAEKCAAIMKAT